MANDHRSRPNFILAPGTQHCDSVDIGGAAKPTAKPAVFWDNGDASKYADERRGKLSGKRRPKHDPNTRPESAADEREKR